MIAVDTQRIDWRVSITPHPASVRFFAAAAVAAATASVGVTIGTEVACGVVGDGVAGDTEVAVIGATRRIGVR